MAARRIVRRKVDPRLEQAMPDTLPQVLRRVYAARGVAPDAVATPLAAMIPVSELDGTAAAATRLATAYTAQESILIVGDFDADGATATALMVSCLRAFGFQHVSYLVPDRFKFGYGLSAGLVAAAAQPAPAIIVTVDNGISSVQGVAAANALGIDVIVTDHHLPGDVLPAAAVIVNPNAPGNKFPSKALAGVGVAFYVMAALGQQLAAAGVLETAAARGIVADCLDLVALGTVADLVPLDRNNRILVAQGLQRITSGRTRPGMQALFAAAERSIHDACPQDFGFGIAPRLNAAGRLEDMSVGIECLLAADERHAARLASELSRLNQQRRELQRQMQEEAEELLARLPETMAGDAACLYDPGWHQGVVGLVATRIKDQLNRPVIAFADGEEAGVLKGSGRSVAGVHMRDLLALIDAQQPGLILRYGGHAMAAGLSLERARLDEFTAAFCRAVEGVAKEIDPADKVFSDGELEATEFRLELAEELRRAGPWGQAFPEPVFDGRFELVQQRVVGQRHLKLTLRPLTGVAVVDAIAFNQPELPAAIGSECLAAFRLDVNEFRGRRSQQLVVEHIECV